MKVLNNSILFIVVLLSACGDKNDQRGPMIKDEVPTGEVFPTKDVDAYIPNSFAGYVRIENSGLESDNWLVLNNRAIQRSGKQVIVNAANEWMAYGGSGGAHQSIISAAGPNIIDADVKQQKGRFFKQMSGKDDLGGDAYILNPGEAMTTSAGNLKSSGTKYIIHGVGPKFGSTVTADKAEVLKLVYSNIFKEMEKLHTSNSSLKELALMPISGGIFSGGDQNKPAIYDVLISSIVDAMEKYSWLAPTLCVPDQGLFEVMKQRIDANKSFSLIAYSLLSSSVSSGVVSSVTSALHLHANSFYKGHFGALSLNGAACSLGKYRLMGSLSQFVNRSTVHVGLGRVCGQTFIGCEVESSSVNRAFNYCAFKGIGVLPVSDHAALLGAVGYVCENMNTHFPNNIRQFLNQLGIDTAEFKRHGVVGDLSAQYHINIASDVSFTANVGLRATYSHSLELNPFAQVSCQASGSNLALVVSQEEVGLSLGYQY
jgi:O-acetyl-ADP-ribose deacetylase (regulator of RNase III)